MEADMRHSLFLVCAAALVLTAGGCKKSTTKADPDPTSTVQGALSIPSFAVGPTGVVAVDEVGARIRASLAADGGFRLDLPKGHTYTLYVTGGKADEPVVFPRKGGRLDRTFRVSSGASIVTLGLVRHFDRAPAAGFVQSPAKSTSTVKPATSHEQGDGEIGECVDGKVKGTGAACVDDDEKGTCENGSEASDGDGECENGKDAKTGLPCTDNDQTGEGEKDADAAQPMAVPDQNPPDDVGGCNDGGDGDGETNDDAEEAD